MYLVPNLKGYAVLSIKRKRYLLVPGTNLVGTTDYALVELYGRVHKYRVPGYGLYLLWKHYRRLPPPTFGGAFGGTFIQYF
eukprot:SAG31_NODE_235_length_19695_cov_37.959790_14_plen_81_part_00